MLSQNFPDERRPAGPGADNDASQHPGQREREAADAWLYRAMSVLPGAIRQLPPEEQQVVIGHYFDERPLEVLAEELGLQPERVQHLLETALRNLRRGLSD